MGFSGQEYWSGLPCPPPGELPHSRIEPRSLGSPALAGGFFTTSATWEARNGYTENKLVSSGERGRGNIEVGGLGGTNCPV